MNRKTVARLFYALAFLASATGANAASTLSLYESYNDTTGIPNNLANKDGVVTNGMRWGIIVSTTNASFATNYDAYLAGPNTSGFLSVGGVVSDDYFIAGDSGNVTKNGSILGDGADGNVSTAGDGSIIQEIDVSYTNGVSVGDSFALIWFSSNSSAGGDRYGFFTDASFLIPADGTSLATIAGPFVGNDSVRSASLAFAPEPSRVMLLGIGFLGLCFRRRR